MSKKDNELYVVDDNDKITSQASRSKIHQLGLLHREVLVWFFNDRKEVFLQHRKKNAETFPDLLDVTVGGHVEIGDDYITTAIKEAKEETGLIVSKDKLIEIKKLKRESYDQTTGLTNKVINIVYAYNYDGETNDLTGEEDIGFECWSIDKLLHLEDERIKKRFLPSLFSNWMKEILIIIKDKL